MSSSIKPKISAELGPSHESSLESAINLIESCSRIGDDLINFQIHFADSEGSDKKFFRVNFLIQDSTCGDHWKLMKFSKPQREKIFGTIDKSKPCEDRYCGKDFNAEKLKETI